MHEVGAIAAQAMAAPPSGGPLRPVTSVGDDPAPSMKRVPQAGHVWMLAARTVPSTGQATERSARSISQREARGG